MINREGCKGCHLELSSSYYICEIYSSELFKNVTEECPCRECLIKGVCENACKVFIDYLYKGVSTYVDLYTLELIKSELQTFNKYKLYKMRRTEVMLGIQSMLYKLNPYLIMKSTDNQDIIRLQIKPLEKIDSEISRIVEKIDLEVSGKSSIEFK
jgi:hypothetical protein